MDRFCKRHPEGFISAGKGKKVASHIGRYWSVGYCSIDIAIAVRAAWAFASAVMVAFGSLILIPPGLPIGAIVSASCVNIMPDWYEHQFCHDHQWLQANGFFGMSAAIGFFPARFCGFAMLTTSLLVAGVSVAIARKPSL